MIKCFHPQCKHGVATGDTLYRINVKGADAVWACAQHRANTDAPRDPELDRIVKILEDSQ